MMIQNKPKDSRKPESLQVAMRTADVEWMMKRSLTTTMTRFKANKSFVTMKATSSSESKDHNDEKKRKTSKYHVDICYKDYKQHWSIDQTKDTRKSSKAKQTTMVWPMRLPAEWIDGFPQQQLPPQDSKKAHLNKYKQPHQQDRYCLLPEQSKRVQGQQQQELQQCEFKESIENETKASCKTKIAAKNCSPKTWPRMAR